MQQITRDLDQKFSTSIISDYLEKMFTLINEIQSAKKYCENNNDKVTVQLEHPVCS